MKRTVILPFAVLLLVELSLAAHAKIVEIHPELVDKDGVEKDGYYIPPSLPGSPNPKGCKTYHDVLLYDDDDCPVSNQGFHCGALLAAQEMGLTVTEQDIERAIAAYHSLFTSPPNCRVVERSSCSKALKKRDSASGSIPIPLVASCPASHLMDGMGGYAGRSKAVAKPCPNVGNGTTGPIGSRFRPRWTYFRARKSAQNSPLAISLFLAAARMASERRSGGTVTHEIVASPSS
jgi:hypothetical protein